MHWPIRQVPKALEGGTAEIPLLSEHDFNRGGPLKWSVQRGTAASQSVPLPKPLIIHFIFCCK